MEDGIPILQHTSDFIVLFFSGRNTFIICPSKQRNRKYPSAWKWRCHLPSGSCFSLAGGGKHYVIRTFRTASNFRTVSDPLLLLRHVKKKAHIFHIWFLLFPLVQILHPSEDPMSEWDWIWKCQTLQTSSFCWCCGTWQWDVSLGETNTQPPVHKLDSRTHSRVNVGHWKRATAVGKKKER